jgi:pyocin large subunit-like protein
MPRLRVALLLTWILAIAGLALAGGPGFENRYKFEEHYRKHGREFGSISKPEYLAKAQALRDAPVGGEILEARKAGGVVTRFDRKNGYFGAFNPDQTIRTFFIPNAGESYFRRQAMR